MLLVLSPKRSSSPVEPSTGSRKASSDAANHFAPAVATGGLLVGCSHNSIAVKVTQLSPIAAT